MTFIVTLPPRGLSSITEKLRNEQRLTKALSKERRASSPLVGPPLVLVLVEDGGGDTRSRRLAWIGVVSRHNTVGAVDKSITVDPLRECMTTVDLDGQDGLLRHLSDDARREFDSACDVSDMGEFDAGVWQELDSALRQHHPPLISLLDWLLAKANPPVLDSRDPADRAWQEQQDAGRTLLQIADFPAAALTAWRRPGARDAPYLSGIIPQPVEHSLIDHDVRAAGTAFGMLSEWQEGSGVRCDIHVLQGTDGRRLEVANVNATPVESRLGTDMIYYHQPTESFVLVQYKRLDPADRSIYVDKRLRGQLDKLEKVAGISRPPERPSEWRLGSDPCFLKLAHWPADSRKRPAEGLTPGMYLPLSYVRVLLADDCTRGTAANSTARLLGYDHVERHLVNTQFIDLVKHGLVGTVGITIEQLNALVRERAADGQSVMLGAELSREPVAVRQKRVRSRGSKSREYAHFTYGQKSTVDQNERQ